MVQGELVVIVGPMFAGKTTKLVELLTERRAAGKQIQVFRPLMDTREEGRRIRTHDGVEWPAVRVRRIAEVLKSLSTQSHVVAIDEVNMLAENAVAVCKDLMWAGLEVIVAGLDMDYRKQAFAPMDELIPLANDVIRLTARCERCDRPAPYSKRLVEAAHRITPGGKEMYEPRCATCFDFD